MGIPERIGDYRVLSLLGQGGMGLVYRCQRAEGGEVVAVKTIRAQNQSLVRGIRREIQALSRLRHPGIARIFEQGEHEGLPWYAMEFVEGVPLDVWGLPSVSGSGNRTATKVSGARGSKAEPSWWTRSVAQLSSQGVPALAEVQSNLSRMPRQGKSRSMGRGLDEVYGVVAQLCRALRYVHGEGLVHRDLKPANVLVRSDGQPVLVDFGLAAGYEGNSSRESLLLSKGLSGTVAYMAPEQIRGDSVDARADLYALGCVLYELVTGRPPFVASTLKGVLRQHLEAEPEKPSSLRDGLPAELEALVLSLLAKDRRKRIGYADEVASVLDRLGAESEKDDQSPRVRPYVYRPEFVGQIELRQRLEQRLEQLEDAGKGGLVLVLGESGSGKTRLAMEVGKRASALGLEVQGGECIALTEEGRGGLGGPLHPLREVLQLAADRCRRLGEKVTARLFGPDVKVLGQFEPSLKDLPGSEQAPEASQIVSSAMRGRVLEGLERVLRGLCGSRRMVLVLDDLQWCDDLTLEALSSWVHRGLLEEIGLLVLGTCRKEEVGASVEVLRQSASVETVEVGRLGVGDVAQLAGEMLASEVPESFSKWLNEETEGNPFFVAEYVRFAVEERLLQRDRIRGWELKSAKGEAQGSDLDRLAMPRTLIQLVERRLDGVPKSVLLVLQAAAVLGRESKLEVLGQVVSASSEAVGIALEELQRRQILRVLQEDQVRFDHDKLREVAYSRLPEDRRVYLHQAAAEAMEGLPEGELVLARELLALHWERAQQFTRASGHYLKVARHLFPTASAQRVEKLYWKSIKLGESDSLSVLEARVERAAYVLRRLAKRDEALVELESLLPQTVSSERKSLRAKVLKALAVVRMEGGDLDSPELLFQEAISLFREQMDNRMEGATIDNLGNLRVYQKRYSEAIDLFSKALEFHEKINSVDFQLTTLNSLFSVYINFGPVGMCYDIYSKTREKSKTLSLGITQSIGLLNFGSLLVNEGCYREALEVLNESLRLLYLSGNYYLESVLQYNLAKCFSEMEQFDLAFSQLSISDCIAERQGGAWLGGNQYSCKGIALLKSGNPVDAKKIMSQFIERMGSKSTAEALCRHDLMEWELLIGSFEESERHFQVIEATPYVEQNRLLWGPVLCTKGHLELAKGRRGEAQSALEEGREVVRLHGAGPKSISVGYVKKLERAVRAFDKGKPLYRGMCVGDIAEGLRKWLLENGRMDQALFDSVKPKRRVGKGAGEVAATRGRRTPETAAAAVEGTKAERETRMEDVGEAGGRKGRKGRRETRMADAGEVEERKGRRGKGNLRPAEGD